MNRRDTVYKWWRWRYPWNILRRLVQPLANYQCYTVSLRSWEIRIKLIIRSAPIVLSDDEPESGPSSYEGDEPMSHLPDILDLLRSDPPGFDSHESSKVKVKVKVDRKGKGKEKAVLDILEVDEVRKRPRSASPNALVGMGNHYLVEGLSRRPEGRKRARSPVTVSSWLMLDWQ